MAGRSRTGSLLVRRLLPAAVIVPVVLGLLRLEGERAGLYGMTVGVALMIAANVLITSSLILWSARMLDRLHERKASPSTLPSWICRCPTWTAFSSPAP